MAEHEWFPVESEAQPTSRDKLCGIRETVHPRRVRTVVPMSRCDPTARHEYAQSSGRVDKRIGEKDYV